MDVGGRHLPEVVAGLCFLLDIAWRRLARWCWLALCCSQFLGGGSAATVFLGVRRLICTFVAISCRNTYMACAYALAHLCTWLPWSGTDVDAHEQTHILANEGFVVVVGASANGILHDGGQSLGKR